MQEPINIITPWDTASVIHLLKFGTPVLDLNALDASYVLISGKVISEKLIRYHQVLPLCKRGNRLYLAMADPSNQSVLDDIKFHTGLITYSVAVEEAKLVKLIEYVLEHQEHVVSSSLTDLEKNKEKEAHVQSEPPIDDAPIVNFVRHILLDAVKKGASDIHFEPYEKTYRVRYRRDGILYPVATPPLSLGGHIASRIKIMSQLDIAERRVPQDGRFKFMLSANKTIDFRVSTCPTVNGEKVVMRILDPSIATVGIDFLGYEDFQKELFLSTLQKPQGMVLVTGPTGSGKTVSLYTALVILNESAVNISTVEDPVEIHLTGINQVNINLKTGLTFATALKAFLRQDPDIIMVGEMRDLETADIGIKAAQTGHLVLSTLHTNSAAETLTRLIHMGIASYNIAASVTLVIAQRLIRKLCRLCKIPDKLSPDFYSPVGCEHCHQGYKGRIGIYELLPMTQTISEAILQGASSLDIHRLAVLSGMQDLRTSALNKAKDGITSLAEINRIL